MCVIRNGGIRHVEVEYIICVLLGMEALDMLKWSIICVLLGMEVLDMLKWSILYVCY